MPAFIPRLNSDGIVGSRYWSSPGNPYYPNYGMPNCTAYAWGRFWEINNQMDHDEKPIGMIGNAVDWYANSGSYQHGSEPKLGAIACYSGGLIGTGHVGVVEQINRDGNGNIISIVTSNSNYGAEFFVLYTLTPPYNLSDATLQGFIYNPYVDDEPTPTPSNKKHKFPWFIYANKRRFLR